MGNKEANEQADSKVPFDISRAPRGLRAASALVSDLAKLDDRFERHYLEIKSNIDLNKGELVKIAKYILGSANRMPAKAATAFEGYGVMVIGVAPGEITGVPLIEILDIEKIVTPFLGPKGPHWDLVHVPIKDSQNTVLVILVDPPQNGQDAFLCRKDGGSQEAGVQLSNGRIYFRADGETREARATEVDDLIERGKRSASAEVDLEVEVLGYAYPVEINDSRTIDLYVEATVEKLLRALPQPEPPKEPESQKYSPSVDDHKTGDAKSDRSGRLAGAFGPSASEAISEAVKPGLAARAAMEDVLKPHHTAIAKMAKDFAALQKTSAFSSLATTDPEKRTEEEYRNSIKVWESRVRKAWPDAVEKMTGYALDAVSIRLKNKSKTFFEDVELSIHLEGDINGLEWSDAKDEIGFDTLRLPKPPRKWGPTQRSILGMDYRAVPQHLQNMNLPSMYRSPLDWKNGGSVDLTLRVGKLRPLNAYKFDENELVLVLPLTRESHIHGTWQITASGHDEVYSGELKVEVGPPVDLTKLMEHLLKLDMS